MCAIKTFPMPISLVTGYLIDGSINKSVFN